MSESMEREEGGMAYKQLERSDYQERPSSSDSLRKGRSLDQLFKTCNQLEQSDLSREQSQSPAPSCNSMKSDMSMGTHVNFKDGQHSTDQRCNSMKSDWSMDHPLNFDDGHHSNDQSRVHEQRPKSPVPSYYSMESDWSMDHPHNFKDGDHSTDQRVHEQSQSPAPSRNSMKSNWSMGRPFNFSTDQSSMKSDWSINHPDNFNDGRHSNDQRVHEQSQSPAPSCSSMKSDWSINHPDNFNDGQHSNDQRVHEQSQSPAPNNSMKSDGSMGRPFNFSIDQSSMKSDWSINHPDNFNDGHHSNDQRVHEQRSSPVPSCDRSMDQTDPSYLEEEKKFRMDMERINRKLQDDLKQSQAREKESEQKIKEQQARIKALEEDPAKPDEEKTSKRPTKRPTENKKSSLTQILISAVPTTAALLLFAGICVAIAVDQLSKTHREAEMRRMQKHAVYLTLDPDTANPYLILSEDGKQVSDGDIKKNLPDNKERFSTGHCVLGKQSFSSRRFYYEVQVSGTDWDVGVARESINRKGQVTLTPNDGYWAIWLRNGNEYKAHADPPVLLSVKEVQKVGVFVDFEEGLVSFYDVEAKVHLYSFTGCTFTEKLYPYFYPGGPNSAPLIISPVSNSMAYDVELWRFQQYAVDVTLDPDTAFPRLILSEDGKQVSIGDIRKDVTDNTWRFSSDPCVLGKQSFSSGRFYYEVQVKGNNVWVIGVARESINRHKISGGPTNGYWTILCLIDGHYKALAGTGVLLPVREVVQKVGVFVDYEEGLVSFYDVEARVHIYSFTGCTFTEKLYPFFVPGDSSGGTNSAPLIISPVSMA